MTERAVYKLKDERIEAGERQLLKLMADNMQRGPVRRKSDG